MITTELAVPAGGAEGMLFTSGGPLTPDRVWVEFAFDSDGLDDGTLAFEHFNRVLRGHTGTLHKLTIRVDRPRLPPAHIRKLQEVQLSKAISDRGGLSGRLRCANPHPGPSPGAALG